MGQVNMFNMVYNSKSWFQPNSSPDWLSQVWPVHATCSNAAEKETWKSYVRSYEMFSRSNQTHSHLTHTVCYLSFFFFNK